MKIDAYIHTQREPSQPASQASFETAMEGEEGDERKEGKREREKEGEGLSGCPRRGCYSSPSLSLCRLLQLPPRSH